MDKQNVVLPPPRHTYTRIVFCQEKKWNSDTCYSIEEFWKHYAARMQPERKEQLLYDSIWDGKQVLEVDRGDGCVTLWMYLILMNFALKNV